MKQNPFIVCTVLKARVEPQIGDAVSLSVGHLLAHFSILTLLLHPSAAPSCQPQACPYLPSLPEPLAPAAACPQRGEDGDTKASGVRSGLDRHTRASKSHDTLWKEGWGEETLWMEKTCQGSDMLLHRPFLKTKQTFYQPRGRHA